MWLSLRLGGSSPLEMIVCVLVTQKSQTQNVVKTPTPTANIHLLIAPRGHLLILQVLKRYHKQGKGHKAHPSLVYTVCVIAAWL